MADASVRGCFVWHELMTTDPKSAAGFFTTIVGWKTQASPQDPNYTMFVTTRPMAGLMRLPREAAAMGASSSWITYIGSPDVDETARQAMSLGGKTLKAPEDIPTVGRFAILADPQGAVFAAFTPLPGQQLSPAPAVGDFSWHELVTTDWRSALTFYQRLFGWEETGAMDMGPETGTYQMFGLNGKTLGGMFNKGKQMPGPAAWLPYIHVPDSKKTVPLVKKLGGQIINGPHEVPGGDWIAQGLDLQGAMFAVHSLKPAPEKTTAAKAPAKKLVKKVAKKAAKVKQVAKKAPTKTTKKKTVKKKSAGTRVVKTRRNSRTLKRRR